MDRTLVLLRHAKADRPSGTADHDRPLTERGHADAAAAGAWLRHQGYLPDLVLCSPARRTRQTWHSVAVAMAGGSPQVRYASELYDGDVDDALRLLQAAEPSSTVVLVIGHNPTISQLSGLLDPATTDSDGLRTSGIAVHRLDGVWSDLAKAQRLAGHTARAAL